MDISASALEVAVWRGHAAVASRRHEFDRTDWPADWPSALAESRTLLANTVAELQASGLPATVVFSTPGAVIAINACPLSAGKVAAVQAGSLALANVATVPIASGPSDVRILHVDAPASNPGSSPAPAAASPRIHTIAAAAPDADVARLTEWAAQSGLVVDATVPAEAALAHETVRLATGGERPIAVLCVGEHVSVLAVGCAGRLELIRSIAAGSQSIVEALLRPIRPSGNRDAIQLDHAAARRMLADVGIPEAGRSLPDMPGCTGAVILPLLQPIMQRFAIELKQSLRFGVDEATRATITLRLTGSGANVPGLGAALARQASIGLHTPAGSEPTATPSSITANATDVLPTLLAGSDSNQLTIRGLRRALLAGVAAAGALLAVDGVMTRLSLRAEQQRLEAIRANSAGNRTLTDLQDQALESRLAATALHRQISRTLGTTPDWGASLRVLADLVPPTVRVLEARLSDHGTPTCNLNAYIRLDQTVDAAGEIRRFVDAISHHPIVSAVRLGNTQRGNVRGNEAQTFELSIEFVAVETPFLEAHSSAAASEEGATP